MPRRYSNNEIIYHELDQILEMTFIVEGKCLIGYEMNKQIKYKVSYSEGKVIGEYNVLFMKDSKHVYKCKNSINGFALSRKGWMDLSKDHEEMTQLA